MTYYYLEQAKYQSQLSESQQSLNNLAQSYSASTAKRNWLAGQYGTLLGEYQYFSDANYSSLMGDYEELIVGLDSNYSFVFSKLPELNESFNNLLSEFQELNKKDQVTKDEFGGLLDGFYDIFVVVATKEIEGFISETSTINVCLCINFSKVVGEQKEEWHNISVASSTTLFDLSRQVSEVNYSYYPTMEPGHIIITSIGNSTSGWIWYYWDETANDWVWGPIGCDAWTLEDNGIYKWDVFS
jgi:hypothetical protein